MKNEFHFEVHRIIGGILRYLKSRPDAADTQRHIAGCWLPGTEPVPARQVREALTFLVRRGVMEEFRLPGGKTLYKAARKHPPSVLKTAARGRFRRRATSTATQKNNREVSLWNRPQHSDRGSKRINEESKNDEG